MGLPGIAVAVVVRATIVEPRTRANAMPAADRQLPRMTEVLRTMWQQRSARHLSIAVILLLTMGLGLGPWYAAFLMRSHGMGTAELGLWLGCLFGVGGITGILLGAYVVARWFGQDEKGQMRLCALTIASLVPCYVLFLLLPEKHAALVALLPVVIVFSFILGPVFALMQRMVADEMRATTLAVVMLLANLIGMGLGPQIVGILSDLWEPALGADALRYSMLVMAMVAFWASYHFWKAGSTVTDELSAIQQGQHASAS
jgi:predicted MFS family arabinose efflux permease